MSFEILYTSATEGLRKGSHGYCTVVSSAGIPKPLAERLEIRSGYPHPFSPGDPKNPVNYSHLLLSVGGVSYHLLSRIADFGYDYSRRSNKLAHHVALKYEELTPGGPAWILAGEGFCETTWNGKVRLLQSDRKARTDECHGGICRRWGQLCGDPGWAGVLAENAIERKKPAYIIFKPGDEMLPLVVEAMALLPTDERWRTTFSTYYTKLQSVESIQWRFVLDGTQEATSARRDPRITLVDLCSPLGRAPDSLYVQFARTGNMPLPSTKELGQNKVTPPKPPTKATGRNGIGPGHVGKPTSKEKASEGYALAPPPLTEEATAFGFDTTSPYGGAKLLKHKKPRKKPRKKFSWILWLTIVVLLLLVAVDIRFHIQRSASEVPKIARTENIDQNTTAFEPSQNHQENRETMPPGTSSVPETDLSAEDVSEIPLSESSNEDESKTQADQSQPANTNTDIENQTEKPSPKSEAPSPPPPPPKPTKPKRSLKEQLPPYLKLPESGLISHVPLTSKELDLEDPAKLKIELLAANLGWEKDGLDEKFTIEPVSKKAKENPEFNVYYRRTSNGKKSPLGNFKFDGKKLWFKPTFHDSDKERYEVFRYSLLRFSYEGETHICRLHKSDHGALAQKGGDWETWHFQTFPEKKLSRLTWDEDRPEKSPLPARKAVRLDIDLKNCTDDLPEAKMTIHFSHKLEDKTSSDKNKIRFLATLIFDQNEQPTLQLTPKFPLKRYSNLQTLTITNLKSQKFAEPKSIDFSLWDDIKEIKQERDRFKDVIDQADTIKEKKPKFAANIRTVNRVLASYDAWLAKAKEFRKHFVERLSNGSAEIKATLYAIPVFRERVDIITFSTKNESHSPSSGMLREDKK